VSLCVGFVAKGLCERCWYLYKRWGDDGEGVGEGEKKHHWMWEN